MKRVWLITGANSGFGRAIAYHATLHVPFEFDDFESIVNNPSIRRHRTWTIHLQTPC